MKERKIVTRLIRNYTTILVLFAGVMLVIFFTLLNKQVTIIQQEQLKEQGDIIAENLVSEENIIEKNEDMSGHGKMMGRMNHRNTSNSYLNLIGKLSKDDIYIVDESGTPLYNGHMMDENINELDSDGLEILGKINEKKNPLFFEQGDLGNNKRLGYGVPLVNDQNKMYGSVIVLSRKDKTLTQSFADYHLLIWSVSIALIITVFISIGMAKKFVKPIHDMEQFTDDLIKQNYSSTLDIKTKDELATLGNKLAVLSDRLAFAKNEQDNKEKSQKLFLSQISHELRTPVMVIKNSLETLNSDFLNETEKKDYIHHLMKETEQLNLLVNDLLELSRLQSTEFSITTEELNLNYVIQDSMRSYRPILKDKNQSISFESDINEEPMFVGDYQRLLQLMKILIDNASKYSADNSVIDVHLKKVGNNYEVSVRNTPNFEIDEVRMSHIFDAFNRGSEKQENGHGLGLTIAEQIVKRHFGKIYFQIIDNSIVEVVIKL